MKSDTRIRIGFIGLNPESHWAATAHIPALNVLADDFEIVGVANSTPESAQKTASAMGLRHAFNSPLELVCSDAVDLVVVTVKVPHHYEYITAALNAGKHVHSEWPLGNGLNEAKALAKLADEKGVSATVGTQMRTAPEILYLKALLADGYVGEVLSTTLIGSGGNWGAETLAEHAYLYDKDNGATMLEIPFAHTLAGMKEVLGDVEDISGRLLSRRQKVRVSETNTEIERSDSDQILVNGVFTSGVAFSAHYRGGICRGTNLLWEINGTYGDIQITGNIGHGQFAELTIKGAQGAEQQLVKLVTPAKYYEGRPEGVIACNVAGIYALVANDIRSGSRSAPSFADALQLHELLAKIEG